MSVRYGVVSVREIWSCVMSVIYGVVSVRYGVVSVCEIWSCVMPMRYGVVLCP